MKYFSILPMLIMLVADLHGQTREEEIRAQIWDTSNEMFNVVDVPEKWKDEPAVIIAQSNELAYKKFPLSRNLWEQNYIHRRIKIQSQQALEDYAQFSYPDAVNKYGFKGSMYVGFKIVKPDGQEIIISNDEAVADEMETGKSDVYKQMKLAIPNLEIGDILDYYMAEELTFFTDKYHSFSPSIFLLRQKYPIIKGKISFSVLRRCFINLNTYNGAPSFNRSAVDEEEDTYEMFYENQEKIDDLPWFYPYRNVPTVKFKVTYASPSAAYQVPNFNGSKPGVLKSTVQSGEVRELLSRYMNMLTDYTGLKKHMKKYKNERDVTKLVTEAFLYERNKLALTNAEYRTVYGGRLGEMASLRAINNLSEYFVKAKIPHKVIAGVPKSIGTLENLILEEELALAMRVETPNPVYIASFGAHDYPGMTNPVLEGSEVYISNINLGGSSWSFVTTTFPESSKKENGERLTIDIELDLDEKKTLMDVTKTFLGHFKSSAQYNLMDFYDIQDEEEAKFEMESSTYLSAGKLKKRYLEKEKEYWEGRDKKRIEALKEMTENNWNFDIDTLRDLHIIQTGRSLEKPEFQIGFNAETSDLISKLGQDYLFDVGKLIEQQIEILKEHKTDREYPVEMGFARSFESTFHIKIPEGFEVLGVEELNRKVQNETGGFVAESSIQNDVLTVVTKKEYNTSDYPPEKWPEIIVFLEEAEDFQSEKLLLKKL